jgi:hypothetical protein
VADAPAVAAAYPWGTLGHVADLGGGNASLLIAILRAHSDLRGTVIDLPGRSPAPNKPSPPPAWAAGLAPRPAASSMPFPPERAATCSRLSSTTGMMRMPFASCNGPPTQPRRRERCSSAGVAAVAGHAVAFESSAITRPDGTAAGRRPRDQHHTRTPDQTRALERTRDMSADATDMTGGPSDKIQVREWPKRRSPSSLLLLPRQSGLLTTLGTTRTIAVSQVVRTPTRRSPLASRQG